MAPEPLVLTRILKADPATLFKAWSDPSVLIQWMGPQDMDLPVCEVDFTVGGRYTFGMRSPEGNMHTVSGKYIEIIENEKIVFTWQWEEFPVDAGLSEVTVTFARKDDVTEMTLHHAKLASDQSCVEHSKGWNSTFDCLEQLF